ncbi:MAG: WD40 repeat domain-containing protein, partial [Chloroflexia bacterium]
MANRKFAYIEANKDIRVRHLTDAQFNNDIYIEDTISLAVSYDGAYLVTGLRSGDAVVWDMATLAKRFRVSGHSSGVQVVEFAPFSYVLATTDWRNTRVWESGTATNSYDVRHELGNNDLPVKALVSHYSGYFSVCSAYGNCEFWTADLGVYIDKLNLDSLGTRKVGQLRAIGTTEDDKFFLTGWQDGSVNYWDNGALAGTYETVVDGANMRAMAFSWKSDRMALVTPDNHVQIWRMPK